MPQKRKTILDIISRKSAEPLVSLTCYTAPFAKILDSHVDILLVGDSLGMMIYGMESTLPVTLEMMINHGRAVVNSSKSALVVVDMPFGSYQASKESAFGSAARIMQETGCQAVKLEGGREMAETISYLTQRGIPVMGHIGLLPQHVNNLGGYKLQGKTQAQKHKIKSDAEAIAEAGAFGVVLEGIVESLAREITENLMIPTIGIGASVACDGQVLVIDDMLGLNSEFTPKFVKKFSHIAEEIEKAVSSYSKEVKQRKFPAEENTYN